MQQGPSLSDPENRIHAIRGCVKSPSDRFALLRWLANMDFFQQPGKFGRKICHKSVSSDGAIPYLMNQQSDVPSATSKTGTAFV